MAVGGGGGAGGILQLASKVAVLKRAARRQPAAAAREACLAGLKAKLREGGSCFSQSSLPWAYLRGSHRPAGQRRGPDSGHMRAETFRLRSMLRSHILSSEERAASHPMQSSRLFPCKPSTRFSPCAVRCRPPHFPPPAAWELCHSRCGAAGCRNQRPAVPRGRTCGEEQRVLHLPLHAVARLMPSWRLPNVHGNPHAVMRLEEPMSQAVLCGPR